MTHTRYIDGYASCCQVVAAYMFYFRTLQELRQRILFIISSNSYTQSCISLPKHCQELKHGPPSTSRITQQPGYVFLSPFHHYSVNATNLSSNQTPHGLTQQLSRLLCHKNKPH